MGGRGSNSGMTASTTPTPAPSPQQTVAVPRTFTPLTQQEVDDMAQEQNSQYDINTRLAINQYIREDVQANGYTMSQNLNHALENDLPLNANESYVHQRLLSAMHDIGKNTTLVRAAHKDFLEALGVRNYQNMTDAQLNAAVTGAEYQEKKFVSAAFDPNKNPFISGSASGGREVYINIKAPSDTKCVLGNAKQSEAILSPGTKFRATGAHFDGTYAYPRLGGRLPRVVIDVEIIP